MDRYYRFEEFSSIPKIDAHCHYHTTDGRYIQFAQDHNFRLLTVNTDTKFPPDYTCWKQRATAIGLCAVYPHSIGYIAVLPIGDLGSANFADHVLEVVAQSVNDGAVGVKIWKNIGMSVLMPGGEFLMVDDPLLDPIFLYLEEKQIPVLGHLGEPKNCWLPLLRMTVSSDRSYFERNPEFHMFRHKGFPSYEKQIACRDSRLAKNPDLLFVGAHLGSLEWDVKELAKRLDRFPNMAVDVAERVCHLQYQSASDRSAVRDFFLKYQDRILYGTDCIVGPGTLTSSCLDSIRATWLDDWRYFTQDETLISDHFRKRFRALKLPKSVIDKLYYENAMKWYFSGKAKKSF